VQSENEKLLQKLNIFLFAFQAPFYPREAVKKGLEVWHFCLVFGAFEITVFIVSPLIGANLNRIGVKVCKTSFPKITEIAEGYLLGARKLLIIFFTGDPENILQYRYAFIRYIK
jgi:hypothetical protein